MRQFATLGKLTMAPLNDDIYMQYARTVDNFQEDNPDCGRDIDIPFESIFGGDVFVAEYLSDIKEILQNMGDQPEGELLLLTPSADPKYYEWFFVTNNSGGPTYYVPKDLFDRHYKSHPDVMDSLINTLQQEKKELAAFNQDTLNRLLDVQEKYNQLIDASYSDQEELCKLRESVADLNAENQRQHEESEYQAQLIKELKQENNQLRSFQNAWNAVWETCYDLQPGFWEKGNTGQEAAVNFIVGLHTDQEYWKNMYKIAAEERDTLQKQIKAIDQLINKANLKVED